MRLLNRLNQYQRLWQPSAGKPQTVTVSELAERCFCSERHVRTLLRQAQEAGWLEWQAQSGRGKRGQLRFLVTPESLRNAMMEQALETGKQQDVLELAQLAPGELRTLLQPFMGGQWQNDTPTLRIPYYRPLEPLQPGFLPGRAEQHLAGQIFSGLTRFDNNTQRPIGDLAHHWETSTDGLRWDFYLRSTLHWHNGDAVKASHLHQRLLMLLQLPALDQLFISVKRIEVTHPQCLTFFLHRPDYWLAHRLASYCSHLAHPQFPLIGTGPFRLTQFTAELVALEINNSSFLHSRKGSEDNCRAVAAAVRDAGGWVALGSDSHTAFTMGEFEECLKILDAVDFPPERILNVSPRRLLNFLESRGMAPIAEFADL